MLRDVNQYPQLTAFHHFFNVQIVLFGISLECAFCFISAQMSWSLGGSDALTIRGSFVKFTAKKGARKQQLVKTENS